MDANMDLLDRLIYALQQSGGGGTGTFAKVATTGQYGDLLGLPTIPTVPTALSGFTNDVGFISAANTPLSHFNNDAGFITSTQANAAYDATGSASAAQAAAIAAARTYTDTSSAARLATAGGTMSGTLVLSDSSPAASQAYVAAHAGSGGTGSSTQPLGTTNEVAYSASPTFNLTGKSVQHMILSADVNAVTVSGAQDGQLYVFAIEQDSNGNHAFTFPSTFLLADPIGPNYTNAGASTVCAQIFAYLGTSGRFIKVAPTIYG
jgi:hypothetical protein